MAQTARPPESEDDPGEADTSPDTDETPGSEGAPDATDDDAAVPGPAPGSNVDPSKPGLQVASPEEENPAPPVDETGEEIPQEDLPRRDVYVEISFDTGDAVAVEVWQDGEWVEVASKPQFVPGARNMKGRAIVKLEQVGDTPPRVRVRNRSQDNAIISDRDRSRTIRTEEDGIVKVQFEDNFTVNEDGTAGGDDYQDVVVRHADNPDDLLETATSLGGSINAVELSEGYENLYTTREVYAEVGLFSNDELIVEVRDPETGAWTEVARKEEGAVLLGNGRTAVKVNQAGTQPPEIRVRNVTAEGEGEPTVIYSSHDKRVQTRTIGDATVFGFEDRWGTSEDDRFNDVMVSFTDTPPEGVEVVDGPITPPTGDASNSETDSENDHYITFNVDVLEPDRDYLVTTTDPETGKEVVVFDSTDSNFDLSAVKVPASTDDRFPSLELKTSTDGGETWNEREEWAESIDFTGDQTNNADGAMRRVTFNDAEQQPYPEPVKKTPLIQISMEVTFVDPDAPIYELPAVNGPPAKITIKFPEPAALGYQDADFRVLANPRSFLTGGSEDSEVVDYDSTDPDASSGTFILPKTLDGTDVDLQIQMKVDGEWRTMNFRTAVSKDGTTTTYTYYEIEDSLYENPILSVSVDQPNGAKSDDKSPGPNINTENDAENGITRTSKNLPLVSKENATTEDILVTFERGDAKLLEVWDPVLGEWRELHRSEAESGDQVTVINDDGDGDTNGRYRAIVSVNWIKTEQDYSNPELKPRFRMTNLTTGEVTDSVVDRKKMRTDVRDGYRIGFEANYDGTNTDLPVGAQGVDGPQTQSGDGQDYNDVTVLFSPSIDQTPVDVGMNDVTVGEDLRLLRRDAKVNDIRDLLGPGDNFDRSDAVQFKIDGLSGKILVNGEELGDFDDRDADGDDATDFLNLTVAAKTWNRDLQDSGLGAADGALMKMFLSQNEGIDFSTAGNTGGYFSFPPRASRRGGYLTVLAGVNSDILGQIFEVAIGGLLGSIFGPSKSYPSKKMPDSMLLVAVWEGLDLKGDKEVPLAGSDGGTVNIPDYHSLSEGWKEARNRDAVKKVTNYSTGLDGAETKKKTISHSDTGFDDDEEYYEFSWQEPNGENVEFGELGAIWWTLATGNVSAGERDQLIRSFRGSLEYFNENFADKLGVKKVNTTTADDFSPNGLDMTGDDARYVLRMLNGGVEIAGDVAENPGDYPGVVLNNDGKTWSFDPSALTPVQRVAIVVGILRIKSLTSEQKSAILERLGISQDDIDALAEKFPTIEGDLDTNLLMGAYRFDGADFISVGTGGKLLSLNTELVAEARAVKPLLGFDDEMLTALGLGPRFQQAVIDAKNGVGGAMQFIVEKVTEMMNKMEEGVGQFAQDLYDQYQYLLNPNSPEHEGFIKDMETVDKYYKAADGDKVQAMKDLQVDVKTGEVDLESDVVKERIFKGYAGSEGFFGFIFGFELPGTRRIGEVLNSVFAYIFSTTGRFEPASHGIGFFENFPVPNAILSFRVFIPLGQDVDKDGLDYSFHTRWGRQIGGASDEGVSLVHNENYHIGLLRAVGFAQEGTEIHVDYNRKNGNVKKKEIRLVREVEAGLIPQAIRFAIFGERAEAAFGGSAIVNGRVSISWLADDDGSVDWVPDKVGAQVLAAAQFDTPDFAVLPKNTIFGALTGVANQTVDYIGTTGALITGGITFAGFELGMTRQGKESLGDEAVAESTAEPTGEPEETPQPDQERPPLLDEIDDIFPDDTPVPTDDGEILG
ncbi:hypothetical protein [uncultured Tateyamaria sp.]|uniref:hypothetical protein n=1 Tax=uncultured Tateyamaria sp. TaxID=455651 RepID=UPI002605B3CB|nr:hypothetical protein [uncultured Tateyamaria sp.]